MGFVAGFKALTWNIDDLMPPTEKLIFSFQSKEELQRWHLYSDSELGGLSSASLEIADSGDGLRGVFSGNLSSDLDEDSRWNMKRSGFCGMRSKKDLIHADGLFSKYKDKCDIQDIALEMYQIVRPHGAVIIRAHVDMINQVKDVVQRLGWNATLSHSERGPLHPEKVLFVDLLG